MGMFYQRVFAAAYDAVMSGMERREFAQYRTMVVTPARDRVLEIGAGTGANLPYYAPGTTPTLTEPSPYMLKRLREKAAGLGLDAAILQQSAEHLDFPDGSFDTVVVTLALCTVADLPRGLGEIRRVLVPGGELRFMEHVRANTRFWALFQDAVAPIWKQVGAGCNPNRNTLASIQSAGFELVKVVAFRAGPYPTRPFVAGVARRPGSP